MLHSKKSQSILQWFNALTTKGDVNSLAQFTDGSHFYEIVASLQPISLQENKNNLSTDSVIFSETSIACNEEVITSVEEEAPEGKLETSISEGGNADPFVIKESDHHTDTQKKYDVIHRFIDNFYHLQSSSLIDYTDCQNGKELELAKIAIFLLSAMVQNLLSSQDKVVYNTTLLEPEVQANIHECLSFVLVEKDTEECQLKKSDLNKMLGRSATIKGTPIRRQPSRSIPDPNDTSEGAKNNPKRRKERTSVIVYEDIQESPLKNLLESPKIQYKAAIFRKESELAKLRGALHTEENKVMDLTLEKRNLNKELENKNKELEFYKKELESQRQALGEKEEHEKLRAEELQNKKLEEERIRKLIESQEEEIKQLKENNENLLEKLANVEEKLEQDTNSFLIEENNSLKEKIQILELDNERKSETIKILNEKMTSVESDLKMYQQMYQDLLVPPTRKELRSPRVAETLSTIIYADAREQERRDQEARLDTESKDERIKRLELQQRKGDVSKSKIRNTESLQATVDRLLENVHGLEIERDFLKHKLDRYESKFGPNVDDAFKAKGFKPVKNETDQIGSASDDVAVIIASCSSKQDGKLDGQANPNVSDDLEKDFNSYSPQKQEEMLLAINRSTLITIISLLKQRNWGDAASLDSLKKKCDAVKYSGEFTVLFQQLEEAITKRPTEYRASVSTRRSRSLASEEVDPNSLLSKNQSLAQEVLELKQKVKSLQVQIKKEEGLKVQNKALKASDEDLKKKIEHLKQELATAQEKCKNMEKLAKKKDEDIKKALLMKKTVEGMASTSNEATQDDLKKEIQYLKQEVSVAQEKYINMEKLAKKKDEDVKKALIMYQRIVKLNKKNMSAKQCGEECEKLRRRAKELNSDCLDFEQETAELKITVKNLEDKVEYLRHEIKELTKENKELKHKLWLETSALSDNIADRDAVVYHNFAKSRHEVPKTNKDLYLKRREQQNSFQPLMQVNNFIRLADNEPSASNSMLASSSIHSGFFQAADEDDFLNESSLAEIHNGGGSGDSRLQEIRRRNTLCPRHLQSSYPLEIQDMTPSEKKYYDPEEISFDLGRKSSMYEKKNGVRKIPKSKYVENDSDDSDDSISYPIKKRKAAEKDCIPEPIPKKQCRPVKIIGPKEKPSTPLKRVAAFVKRQSTFKTPISVHRLMSMPRKSKAH